ncbi:VanW family protein [Paludicola sp. MB14-C6]|uniref:VanW family protein n=1 Tax=Paludihabitans sp. MB14-C6 TaxID=3070656 RepID=UPI0027DC01D4|nr:VanW family protein [Paludicola sp. MB14-C6]WMJ24138.1 VanW family protein [Paludicola sp. MB14-C6]
MDTTYHNEQVMKPISRTKLRLKLGKFYYTTRRYLSWCSGKYKFATQHNDVLLPNEYFFHQTPLLRKLKDVDMVLQVNKITNLKIAVKKLNNVVIYPGETFSYWKLIGKPTAKKGYLEGMVLFCGTFAPGVGGGLCQLSNLIYWMTIHTPLTIIERYRHSFDVFPDSNRTQPFGSGATCVYNYRDLMIKNETNQPFQLYLEVTDQYLQGKWFALQQPMYSYEVYEKNHKVELEYWGGYSRHNLLYRKKYNCFGELVADEYVAENHAMMMYSPFLESGESKSK